MFLILILFICLICIMIVFNLLKSPKLFSKRNSLGIETTSIQDETSSRNYSNYIEEEQTENLELEFQSNLRLLEYLMTMEFNVNTTTFKSLDDVKRFKDYHKLRTDVQKRILNIVDIKESSIDS